MRIGGGGNRLHNWDYRYYRQGKENDEKANILQRCRELVKRKKAVKKMNAKYQKGRKIVSVGDFEKSSATFFRVRYGANERTVHRGFLTAWQYNTLHSFIHGGCIYEAEHCADGERKEDE